MKRKKDEAGKGNETALSVSVHEPGILRPTCCEVQDLVNFDATHSEEACNQDCQDDHMAVRAQTPLQLHPEQLADDKTNSLHGQSEAGNGTEICKDVTIVSETKCTDAVALEDLDSKKALARTQKLREKRRRRKERDRARTMETGNLFLSPVRIIENGFPLGRSEHASHMYSYDAEIAKFSFPLDGYTLNHGHVNNYWYQMRSISADFEYQQAIRRCQYSNYGHVNNYTYQMGNIRAELEHQEAMRSYSNYYHLNNYMYQMPSTSADYSNFRNARKGQVLPTTSYSSDVYEQINMRPSVPNSSLFVNPHKKLLILDLNGLLADINTDYEYADLADTKIRGKLVFKRPFCDEFLRYCFEKFEIGVWSSRMKKNVDSVVDFVMGDLKRKLLFCWDMSHCTPTGYKTIDNMHKPLVLKELKKLWENADNSLPWPKGHFSPSNTLLIDDSPYKALFNPPHTAIFPLPYSYKDKDDTLLGPHGQLSVYLNKLADAKDVRSFVQEHPFGQSAISEMDPQWNFYHQIILKMHANPPDAVTRDLPGGAYSECRPATDFREGLPERDSTRLSSPY